MKHVSLSSLLKLSAILFVVGFVFFGSSHKTFANGCTSTGGNWNTTGTWANCGGLVPQAADTVTISSGTVTLDTSPTIASITITGTLTNDGNARTLTLSGTSGTLWTKAGTFTPGTSITVAITSASGTPVLLGTSTTFYNLTINAAATVINQNAANATLTMTISNNFTITAGVFNHSGGSFTGPGSGAGTFTISAGATFCLGGAYVTLNSNATCNSSATDLTARSMPTFQTYTFSSTSNVYYNSNVGSQTVSSTPTYGNLFIWPILTAARAWTIGSGTINVAGNFDSKPCSSGTARVLTPTLGGALIVSGTLTLEGTTTGAVGCAGNGSTSLNTSSGSAFGVTAANLVISSTPVASVLTANASVITLTGTTGTLFTKSGTYTVGTSEIKVTSASGTPALMSAATTFHKLTINSAATVINQGAFAPTFQAVSGAKFYIQSGVFNSYSATITPNANASFQIDSGGTFCYGGTAGSTTADCLSGAAETSIRPFPAFVVFAFDSASTVKYLFDSAEPILNSPSYGNLVLSPKLVSTSRIYTAGGALTVTGDLTIKPDESGAGTPLLTLQTAGNVTVTGATTINTTNSATSKLCLRGTTCNAGSHYNLTTGTLAVSNSSSTLDCTSCTSTITLSGTGTPFTLSSDTFTEGTSVFKYTGNGATITNTTYSTLELKPSSSTAQIFSSGTYAISTLTVGDGTNAGAQGTTSNPVLNISTAMTIASGATYTTGTGTMTFSGSGDVFTVSGGFTASTSNLVKYTGTSTTTLGAGTYYDLEVGTTADANAVTYYVGGNTTIAHVVTIGNAASSQTDLFWCGAYTIDITGSGSPIVTAVTRGQFDCSAGTLQFKGTSATNIVVGDFSTYNYNYGAVSIIPASGSPQYTLSKPTSSDFMFFQGSFILGDGSHAVTLKADTNSINVVFRGNVTFNASSVYTKGTSTTFQGAYGAPSTSNTFTDNTSPKQDLGTTTISAVNPGENVSLTMATDMLVTTLTIDASQTLIIGAHTLTLSGSGTPLSNSGTLTTTSSTIEYSNSGATIVNMTYVGLKVSAAITASTTATVTGALTTTAAFAPTAGTITLNNGASIVTSGSAPTFRNLIIANGATVTTASDFNIGNDITLGNASSVFTASAGTITISSTTYSMAVNSGALTFYNLTVAATPSVQPSDATFSVAGTLTVNSSKTFAPTAGTITMSGVGSGITNSGTSLVFNNLTIAATPTSQAQYNTSYSVAGTLTLNSSKTFAPTSGTITMSAVGSGISNSGTSLVFNNLTIAETPTSQTQYNTSYSVAGTLTLNSSKTFAPTSGTITMSAVGSTITNSGTSLVFNNLTISETPTSQAQYNTSFSVGGTLTLSSSKTFAPTGGTITMSGTGSGITNSGSSLVFNNLTIAATPTSQTQYNTSYSVAGTLTLNSSKTFAPTAGTITMSAVGSTITNSGTSLVFNNLTIAETPTSQAQYNTSYSVGGTLTLNSSKTFAPTGGTITLNGGGTIVNSGSSLVFYNLTTSCSSTAVTANTSFSVAGTLTNGSTCTLSPSSGTITMNNGSSIVNSGTLLSFFDLTVAASATVTTSSSFTVKDLLTVGASGIFNPSGGTITLSGTGSPLVATGTFAPTGGIVQYSGTSANVVVVVYQGLTLGGTGSYTMPGSTTTIRGDLVVTNNATVVKGAGTVLFAAGTTQTVTDNNSTKQDLGNIQISANTTDTTLNLGSSVKVTSVIIDASQTLSANGSNTLTLTAGPWTNNGIFTRSTGTVEVVPTNLNTPVVFGGSTVTTFNNFTSLTGGTILNFKASQNAGFAGTLTLTGAGSNPIYLASDTPGSKWNLNLSGSVSVTGVYIQDSGCAGGTNSIVLNDTNTSQGNNTTSCWLFVVRHSSSGGSQSGSSGGGTPVTGGGETGGGSGSDSGGSGGGSGSSGGGQGGGGGGATP